MTTINKYTKVSEFGGLSTFLKSASIAEHIVCCIQISSELFFFVFLLFWWFVDCHHILIRAQRIFRLRHMPKDTNKQFYPFVATLIAHLE